MKACCITKAKSFKNPKLLFSFFFPHKSAFGRTFKALALNLDTVQNEMPLDGLFLQHPSTFLQPAWNGAVGSIV